MKINLEKTKVNRFSFFKQVFKVEVFVGILIILIPFLIAYKDLKPHKPINANVELSKKLDALIRELLIDEACYDFNNDIFLIHFPEWTETGLSNHWRVEKDGNLDFEELDNGTYYLETNTQKVFNARVYPDVNGLICKKQEFDENQQRKYSDRPR